MKLKLVAVAVTSLLAAGVVNQPRYITKTAINWICTVKFTLSIISLMITEVMVTKLTRVWALKAKRRSMTNWLVLASGNMNSKATVLNLKVPTKTKPVWHSLV